MFVKKMKDKRLWCSLKSIGIFFSIKTCQCQTKKLNLSQVKSLKKN